MLSGFSSPHISRILCSHFRDLDNHISCPQIALQVQRFFPCPFLVGLGTRPCTKVEILPFHLRITGARLCSHSWVLPGGRYPLPCCLTIAIAESVHHKAGVRTFLFFPSRLRRAEASQSDCLCSFRHYITFSTFDNMSGF